MLHNFNRSERILNKDAVKTLRESLFCSGNVRFFSQRIEEKIMNFKKTERR